MFKVEAPSLNGHQICVSVSCYHALVQQMNTHTHPPGCEKGAFMWFGFSEQQHLMSVGVCGWFCPFPVSVGNEN